MVRLSCCLVFALTALPWAVAKPVAAYEPSVKDAQSTTQTRLAQEPGPHTGQLWAAHLVLGGRAAQLEPRLLPVFWREALFWAYPMADGRYEVLLPMPLEVPATPLWLDIDDGAADIHLEVVVADKTYPISRLHVAPRFSVEPPPRVVTERAAIAQALSYSRPHRLYTKAFIKPCAGASTSPFGVRRTFNGVTKTRHLGLDLQSRSGEPVWATNDGVVALAAHDFFYTGNAVFLDHGENLITGVFHLSDILVEAGQTVHRGDIIGRSGNTGRVTGPHVHFSVKLAGSYVDPADLLAWEPDALGVCAPLGRGADDPILGVRVRL